MNLADRASSFIGLGIREIAGPSSHPQILSWIKRTEKLFPTDLTIDDSKYAWCGVFVGNMVLDAIAAGETLPKPPRYFQRAAAWKEWGTARECKKAERGDVVVLTRKGGYHVGLVAGVVPGGIKVIGGNQSNALTIAEFPWEKVIAVRAHP